MVLDVCLTQLPNLLDESQSYKFVHSSSFAEQLTAFEVVLSRASISRDPQMQLPIVLQVITCFNSFGSFFGLGILGSLSSSFSSPVM